MNENITTAEYWEYDSRIARRWNVDPKPNVSTSPYAVFENNPILNSDVFGDSPPPSLEHKYWYINQIKEFKTNGSISDAPVENITNAAGNGAIKILNFAPALWNSLVKNVQGLNEGTWSSDVRTEVKTGFNKVSDVVSYPFLTPFNQWGPDAMRTADNPNTLATALAWWATAKIPSAIGGSQNVSRVFHSTTSITAVDNILATGVDPAFFSAKSRFGKGFYTSTTIKGTTTELGSYGYQAAATIGFNLEKPILLNATGSVLNLAAHIAPKMMGGMVRSFGLDGIIYNSAVPGTSGVNVVLFKNFQKLTNGAKQ